MTHIGDVIDVVMTWDPATWQAYEHVLDRSLDVLVPVLVALLSR